MSLNDKELEQYEKDIVDAFERGEYKSVKHLREELRIAEEAAEYHTKRDARINIRISNADLDMVKRIAAEEGLPYQTLLASLIHKFAMGRVRL